MSLLVLAQAVDTFKNLLNTTCDKLLVVEVSLQLPANGQNEAAFIQLVLWGYVFWFEACQPAGNYLSRIVRNSSPEDFQKVSRNFNNIQNLRTLYAHNLHQENKGDLYKLTQANIWLSQNGKDQGDWSKCTNNLCLEIVAALIIFGDHWKTIIHSPEDRLNGIRDLNQALERDWEPHLFDSIILEVAASLSLDDFDVVAYRKMRLADYRKITDCFVIRISAESAIRRFIKHELTLAFGA